MFVDVSDIVMYHFSSVNTSITGLFSHSIILKNAAVVGEFLTAFIKSFVLPAIVFSLLVHISVCTAPACNG